MVGHCFWKLFSWTQRPALVLNILSTIFASIATFFLTATVYYLTNGNSVVSMFSSRILIYYFLSSLNCVWGNIVDSICAIRGFHNE